MANKINYDTNSKYVKELMKKSGQHERDPANQVMKPDSLSVSLISVIPMPIKKFLALVGSIFVFWLVSGQVITPDDMTFEVIKMLALLAAIMSLFIYFNKFRKTLVVITLCFPLFLMSGKDQAAKRGVAGNSSLKLVVSQASQIGAEEKLEQKLNQQKAYDIAKYIIGLLKDGRVLDASEYCYLHHESVPYNCMNKGCLSLVDAMLNFGQIYSDGRPLKPTEIRAFQSSFKDAVSLLMLGLAEAELATMPPEEKLLNQKTANDMGDKLLQLLISGDEQGAVMFSHKNFKVVPTNCINEACMYLSKAMTIMHNLYVERRKATKSERNDFDAHLQKYAELQGQLSDELEKKL